MLKDKRKSERYAVSGFAKIQCGAGGLPRDCRITDISDGGVRLLAEGLEIPEEFVLWLTGPGNPRRDCRVAWRLGHEIGAEFTDRRRPDFARLIVDGQARAAGR